MGQEEDTKVGRQLNTSAIRGPSLTPKNPVERKDVPAVE
jgi:hypothetical protein